GATRRDGRGRAPAPPRPREHRAGLPLSDARRALGRGVRGRGDRPGVRARLQPLDRRLLRRLGRAAPPGRAALARRPGGGAARAPARGGRRRARRLGAALPADAPAAPPSPSPTTLPPP